MKTTRAFTTLFIALLMIIPLVSCNINLQKSESGESTEQNQTKPQQSSSQNTKSSSSASSSSTPPSVSSKASAPAQSASEKASQPSSSQSVALETIPSKIVPVGDESLSFPSDTHAGTQEELDRWHSLISEGTAARINVCNMSESEAELSEGQFNSIMKTLAGAEISIYEELGNPMTGGAVHVVAYNSKGSKVWHVVYNGEWFMVDFTSGSVCIFNGEGTTLDDLYTIF